MLFLSCYSLLRVVAKPTDIAGGHNQFTGLFIAQPFNIRQVVDTLLGKIFQRTNTARRQLERHFALQLRQI